MKKKDLMGAAAVFLAVCMIAASMAGCGKKEEEKKEGTGGFVSEEIEEEVIEEEPGEEGAQESDEKWYWDSFGTGEMKYEGTDRYMEKIDLTGACPIFLGDEEESVLTSANFYEGAYSWIDDTLERTGENLPYTPCIFRAENDDAYPEYSLVFISAQTADNDLQDLSTRLYDLRSSQYSDADPETIVTTGPAEMTVGDYTVTYTRTQYEELVEEYDPEDPSKEAVTERYPAQEYNAIVHIPLEKGEVKLAVLITDRYKDPAELPDESILNTVISSLTVQGD